MSEIFPKVLDNYDIDYYTGVYLEELPVVAYKLWIVVYAYEDGNECNCSETRYFDNYAEAVSCFESYKKGHGGC